MNFKRILNVVGALLLIALVVPFVVYAVPAVVGADHSFVVLTASMTPAIAPGDVVIVADRDPARIAEGDVITFIRGNNEVPVTHRVTSVTEGTAGLAFETKGDANSDVDSSLVPAGNVVGTVILTIPYIGYVVQFTNTPYGFVALVAGPIGLFVASELWTLYRRRSSLRTDSGSVAGDAKQGVDTGSTTVAGDALGVDGPEGTSGFVVTARTLEGSIPPLVTLVAYSGYTVFLRPDALAVAVAVGGVITLLAVVVLRWSARGGGGVPPSSDAEPDAESDDSREAGRPTADGGLEGSTAAADAPDTDPEGWLPSDDRTVER